MAKHARHAAVSHNRPMNQTQVVAYAQKERGKRRSRKVAAIIVGIIVVLLLALGGVALWFTVGLNNALGRTSDAEGLAALDEAKAGQPFYMLIMASDTRTNERDTSSMQYTDVMMLARVDNANRKVTLLSIPRDTRYVLDDGSSVKMNSLYGTAGLGKVVDAVSELTGVPVSHYGMVYMSDVKNAVDAVGGVEVNVEVEINNNDPVTEENVNVQPGLQTLDGTHAQAYAISRKEANGNQDQFRQQKVRTLLGALADKVLSMPAPSIPGKVIELAQYFETDMSGQDIVGVAASMAVGGGKFTLYQGSGPSDGGLDEATQQWFCYDNPEGWAQVMAVVDSGGDPSTVTYN